MLIGISGKKGSGKDTTAKLIKEQLDKVDKFVVRIESFAKPIKLALMSIFDWGYEVFEQDKKEVKDPYFGISPREAMQLLGTDFAQYMLCDKVPEFKETIGRNLWVKLLEKDYIEFTHRAIVQGKIPVMLVPDVRFPHEYNFIEENLGTILTIERRLEENQYAKHESEAYKIPSEYTIINNGSLLNLEENVRDFIQFSLNT